MKLTYKFLLSAAIPAAALVLLFETAWTKTPRGADRRSAPAVGSAQP